VRRLIKGDNDGIFSSVTVSPLQSKRFTSHQQRFECRTWLIAQSSEIFRLFRKNKKKKGRFFYFKICVCNYINDWSLLPCRKVVEHRTGDLLHHPHIIYIFVDFHSVDYSKYFDSSFYVRGVVLLD